MDQRSFPKRLIQIIWQAAKETPYQMLVEPFVILFGWFKWIVDREKWIKDHSIAQEEIHQLRKELHIAQDERKQWRECCQRVQRDYDMAYESITQEFNISSYNHKTGLYEPLCDIIRRIKKEA